MNSYKSLLSSLSLSLITTAASVGTSGAQAASITEFSTQDNDRLGWKIVDDGVMGGLSKGRIDLTSEGILRFGGKLSLENNGGFSSLRSGDVDLDLSASDGLEMRVKGDGRTYQLRIASDARYRGMEVSFMAEFPTTKGAWIDVRVPFSELVGSWRGRSLDDEVFNPSSVQRLGVILADKNPGSFGLEIEWIRTFESGETVVDVAVADGRFSTLASVLGKSGLVETLQGNGPFTVFAPTDDAFAALPEATVEKLMMAENMEQLQSVLSYHVLPGKVELVDALRAESAETVQGEAIAIGFSDGRVRVGNAAIQDADIQASNGVIHVIDTVLLPPSPPTDLLGIAKKAGVFGTLLAAVDAAGLTGALSGDDPITVLAPTDEAFAKLPKGAVEGLLKPENIDQLRALLTYHAFSGKVSSGDALNAKSARTISGDSIQFAVQNGLLKANDATVLKVDVSAENGIIHFVDTVLFPPTCESSKTKEVSLSPTALIEKAIDRGVPAFNRGDHSECSEIYRKCLIELSGNKGVESNLRALAIEVARGSETGMGSEERAWILRKALDRIYVSLS